MDMNSLGKALDKVSYEWLTEAYPELVEAIEAEMNQGATPTQVKRFVLGHTQRVELALRCEQAARHVAAVTAGQGIRVVTGYDEHGNVTSTAAELPY